MDTAVQSNKYNKYLIIVSGIVILVGLYAISLYSYLLYHSFIEIFSIIVAAGIFMVAWNSRKFLDNNYLLFIGIAYMFIAFLDLIHTLAYKGMGVFPGFGSNLATQLWIFPRYVESLSLLIAVFFINRKLRSNYLFLGYGIIIVVFLLSVFYWKIFPDCFIEGSGLTPFKIISEYIISLILLITIFLLIRRRKDFNKTVFRLIIAAIAITIFEEMAFTLYSDVYGVSNLIGHYLKLVSFYLIYKAIIETGLVKPFNLLFRKLKKSEEALREKSNRLELVNKELESFAYSVSHDLRAPLRSIDGFSQALKEDYNDKLDDEGKDFINRIRSSTQRMGKLIDDLLILSRITRKEVKYENVDLSNLANEIAKDLKAIDPERDVKFTIAPQLTASADTGLMRIVLNNLLDNAFKFTGRRKKALIELGITNIDGKKTYFVKDNGVGLDMAYVQTIFAPFQRLHSAAEFEGTGIGLATVQRIISLHNGDIRAEGKKGAGATFYFTI